MLILIWGNLQRATQRERSADYSPRVTREWIVVTYARLIHRFQLYLATLCRQITMHNLTRFSTLALGENLEAYESRFESANTLGIRVIAFG
jgi:hypothetical protein